MVTNSVNMQFNEVFYCAKIFLTLTNEETLVKYIFEMQNVPLNSSLVKKITELYKNRLSYLGKMSNQQFQCYVPNLLENASIF